MKILEKKRAIELRERGIALGEIAKKLNVAKATVSYWVRDISLSKTQIKQLRANSHSREAIEKRRLSRMTAAEKIRDSIREEARQQAVQLIKNPLWCVAIALYWGEGGKTQRTVRIANSDPSVIRLLCHFFRNECHVPLSKMRAHVHAFSHSDIESIEKYWSKISGIPRNQFFKAYIKQSSSSKEKRQTLPNGTMQIYVHDSSLFIKIIAWIEYLKEIKHYD
ncbi:MAG: hypothetical protein RLZZ360_174 [Candidatus Parcubacteria bacterium]|jgi:transposase-like protein